ncbi:MAG TPA: uracil-DNA glycosylase [Roseiflexaceae bacterium]|nr:uracil-DNA glycosylase [Roseiflexaceae bacterium]
MIHLLNDQSCARCSALAASRSRIVHGYGDPQARVIFVGEAPGRHGADRTGTPFSGDKSGRMLQRMLIELGLEEESAPVDRPQLRCFVTNAVRCCPPNNRTPTPTEIANCAPLLAIELDRLVPRVVVPVGRVALREVGLRYLGRDPGAIRLLHAQVLQAGDCAIVPLFHPARISHAQIAAFIETMRGVLGVNTIF